MKPEYEARFLDIDPDAITAYLAAHRARQIMPRTLMRRIVFINADIDSRGGWLRLRQQGERTFLTYKQVAHDGPSAIDSILEAETEVVDFQATRHLLEAMGYTAKRFQENYREEWKLDDVTYDIDTWPDLPTYLEIEGMSKQAVHAAAAALGLDLTSASYGSVDEVYRKVLGRDILAESSLTFGARVNGSDDAPK
jgi:adenylate cyclase class 2